MSQADIDSNQVSFDKIKLFGRFLMEVDFNKLDGWGDPSRDQSVGGMARDTNNIGGAKPLDPGGKLVDFSIMLGPDTQSCVECHQKLNDDRGRNICAWSTSPSTTAKDSYMCLITINASPSPPPNCRARSIGVPNWFGVREREYEACLKCSLGYRGCAKLFIIPTSEPLKLTDTPVAGVTNRRYNALIPIDQQQPLTRSSTPAVSSLGAYPTPAR